ncbi:hypothetical protein PIB30_060479 [Stylosanthes scabra]|uniref:Uncharacterized protein n=1 Tax=Stylosanthes scabra TaxID=79078 RepID=A0ABU6TKW9_9FABA|nr:hypothetical protein [Stylosanthes scabra]
MGRRQAHSGRDEPESHRTVCRPIARPETPATGRVNSMGSPSPGSEGWRGGDTPAWVGELSSL